MLPPPTGASGTGAQMLAKRWEQLSAVRASAVIRTRLPQGMEGPQGKVNGLVISAGNPERARIEIFTPLGTLGATLLMADGMLQVYQPLTNELVRGPIDSPELQAQWPLPVPVDRLPSLLRAVVPLEEGDIYETVLPAVETASAATPPEAPALKPPIVLEVRREGVVRQRVLIDANGGYPLEDARFDEGGSRTLTVAYSEYGGVETAAGPVAFPQKVLAQVPRPEGTASVEVKLTDVEIAPSLSEDAFRLTFGSPPQVRDF